MGPRHQSLFALRLYSVSTTSPLGRLSHFSLGPVSPTSGLAFTLSVLHRIFSRCLSLSALSVYVSVSFASSLPSPPGQYHEQVGSDLATLAGPVRRRYPLSGK